MEMLGVSTIGDEGNGEEPMTVVAMVARRSTAVVLYGESGD